MQSIKLILTGLLIWTIPSLAYADLTTNLIAYWNLTESTGTRNDSTANALNLTASASSPGGSSGTGPGSQDVTTFTAASSQFLYYPTDPADFEMADGDFTLAGWVYLTTKDAFQWIAGKWNTDEGADDRSYVIYYSTAADRFNFAMSSDGTAGTNNTAIANTFGAVATGGWHFVAARYDATGDTMYISVDAGTSDTTSHAGGAFNQAIVFRLGAAGSNGGETSGFLNGRLAMWGLWKGKKLSDGEITQLYNGGAGCTYAQLTTTCAGVTGTVPHNTQLMWNQDQTFSAWAHSFRVMRNNQDGPNGYYSLLATVPDTLDYNALYNQWLASGGNGQPPYPVYKTTYTYVDSVDQSLAFKYCYRVEGCNDVGCSPLGNYVCDGFPNLPGQPTVTIH